MWGSDKILPEQIKEERPYRYMAVFCIIFADICFYSC